jgi:hypothetical protein
MPSNARTGTDVHTASCVTSSPIAQRLPVQRYSCRIYARPRRTRMVATIKQHPHAQSRHGAQHHAVDAVVFRCHHQCPSCTHALADRMLQANVWSEHTTLCGDVPEARCVCSGGAQHTCSACTKNPARRLYPCLLATSCFEGLRTCSLPSSLC